MLFRFNYAIIIILSSVSSQFSDLNSKIRRSLTKRTLTKRVTKIVETIRRNSKKCFHEYFARFKFRMPNNAHRPLFLYTVPLLRPPTDIFPILSLVLSVSHLTLFHSYRVPLIIGCRNFDR